MKVELNGYPLSHDYVATAPPKGEPSFASPYGGAGARWAPFCADRAGRQDGVIALAMTKGVSLKGGSQRGRRESPPLELDYIKPSPSRTARGQTISKLSLREGAGGGFLKTIQTGWRDQGGGCHKARPPGRRGWGRRSAILAGCGRPFAKYFFPVFWGSSPTSSSCEKFPADFAPLFTKYFSTRKTTPREWSRMHRNA